MDAFLDKLAYHLLDRYHDNLGRHCIVFPNRRAGVFFRHYLKNALLRSAWIPEIYTINGFMEELSGLNYADPIDLNFELFRSYRGLVSSPEPYDEFYHWGEMMIGDFNDIDKYMVDAADLFSNVAGLKEIDNVFDYLTPAQKELIFNFWSHFRGKDLSPEQESFLGIWKILLPLYTAFREALYKKQNGYEGMVYREVAERIDREEYPDIKGEKVIICGFNALSEAERRLFRHLRDSGRGEFYWDYDNRYREGKNDEAGRFIRRNLQEFPPHPDFPDDFNNLGKPKTFTVCSLPSDVLQTKKLHEILAGREISDDMPFNDTAVILCDEDLLQPVLSSIPENIPGLNITMGYPLKNTPVFSFLENLLRLQKNMSARRDRHSGMFYYRDVLSVLNHQYIRAIQGKEAEERSGIINRRNMITIAPDFFKDNDLLSTVFRRVDDASGMTAYLAEILDILVARTMMTGDESQPFTLEKEFIFHIKTRLNKLQQIFTGDPVDTSPETFARLFRKLMTQARIPFEGEPLQGLQLMGILETRLLDFRNIIFLSLNEGVMPATAAGLSYIPASLRYAFGMPTREDRDAIYAYYFYRLIQRADRVDIMYNSRTEGMSTGEPGRYIYQLKYLFDLDIRFETVSFRIGEKKPIPIAVAKTPEVLDRLASFTSEGSRRLSPTSITTYLDCPLRFYFTWVAGIREEDEVAEEIDAPGFGNLLHKTMERLYTPWINRLIKDADFDLLMEEENIKTCLDGAFREVFYKTDDPSAVMDLEGRNIIVYEVIRKMAGAILRHDRGNAPFTIGALEEKVDLMFKPEGMDHSVRIGGTIDRRDLRQGTVHIVDYKTGKVDRTAATLAQLFDRNSWPSGKMFKAILQTFIYSWIYSAKTNHHPVSPELYVASELFRDDYTSGIYFKEGREQARRVEDFTGMKDEFGILLSGLVHEMFNPAIPFRQTEDEIRCAYCPYAGICHRNTKTW